MARQPKGSSSKITRSTGSLAQGINYGVLGCSLLESPGDSCWSADELDHSLPTAGPSRQVYLRESLRRAIFPSSVHIWLSQFCHASFIKDGFFYIVSENGEGVRCKLHPGNKSKDAANAAGWGLVQLWTTVRSWVWMGCSHFHTVVTMAMSRQRRLHLAVNWKCSEWSTPSISVSLCIFPICFRMCCASLFSALILSFLLIFPWAL